MKPTNTSRIIICYIFSVADESPKDPIPPDAVVNVNTNVNGKGDAKTKVSETVTQLEGDIDGQDGVDKTKHIPKVRVKINQNDMFELL